jgi:hypothetical protein
MANSHGAAILDGCTFPQFLERISSHMLIDRDSGLSSAEQWAANRRREFGKLTRMPVGQALPLYEQKAEQFYREQLRSDRKFRDARKQQLSKYRAMETQIRAWKAPRVLAALKRSLLTEVRRNIRYDCQPVGPRPRRMTGHEFLAFVHDHLSRAAQLSAERAGAERRRRRQDLTRSNALRQELARLKQNAIA